MSAPHPTSASITRHPLPPGWEASRSLAGRILFWFELLALAIGISQFFVAEQLIKARAVAVSSLAALVIIAAVVRVVPYFRRRNLQRAIADTLALLFMAGAFSYATGGINSPLLALFLLPLTGAAIALGGFGYGIVATTVAISVAILGYTTAGVDVGSSGFAVWLIGTLAPAIIATTAIAVLMQQMQGAERYIQDLSSTDRLTGLLNHRAFEEIIAREHRKAERDGNPYCVLMIDVENVKQLNEQLGHDAGNQLLIAVAAAIARSIRATDIASRFGGDEFAVLLTSTDHMVASSVAQRIRSHVYAGTISVANRMVRANVHIGQASYPKDKRTYKEVLVLADQRMQTDRDAQRPAGK